MEGFWKREGVFRAGTAARLTGARVWRVAMAVAVCAWYAGAREEEWDWRMPVSQVQRLDLLQRASLDRAEDLHQRGQKALRARNESEAITSFRAAASEWKRFAVEFVNAPDYAIAYASFMNAYDLHLSKDRNTAIKLYAEVIDLYSDTPAVAFSALFWRGQAYADNGEQARALADWRALADDPAAAGHPLLMTARGRLADEDWACMKWESAVSRWRSMMDAQTGGRGEAAQDARQWLMIWEGIQGRWPEVTRLALDAGENARSRADRISRFMWFVWNDPSGGALRDHYFGSVFKGKEKDLRWADYRLALVGWFAMQSALYEEAGRAWEHAVAVFDYRRQTAPGKASEEAALLTKRLRDSNVSPSEKARRACDLIGLLSRNGMPEEARAALGLIADPVDRLWAAYEIEARAGVFQSALEILSKLAQTPDPDVALRAKRTQAYLYKDRMGAYEKAIPLFSEAPDPPSTLWALQDCFWHVGKKDQAQKTLSELVNLFPSEAPRALFQKAEYNRLDGKKTEAIACYRRILIHPDWKRSDVASRAHQALEQMGVETDGAVVSDVN